MIRNCVFILLLVICVACGSKEKAVYVKSSEIDRVSFFKGQILLMNDAIFTNNRTFLGASAFLINYHNRIYAVTARHLLGDDEGTEPGVDQEKLADELISWKLYPRIPIDPAHDTVYITPKGLNYQANQRDVLLFHTVDYKANTKVLLPDFNFPPPGDLAMLIGCPYSEEACRQNIYDLIYLGRDEAGLLLFECHAKVNFSGFSGAPLLNREGKVIAILSGVGEQNGVSILFGTPIGDVQGIKEDKSASVR